MQHGGYSARMRSRVISDEQNRRDREIVGELERDLEKDPEFERELERTLERELERDQKGDPERERELERELERGHEREREILQEIERRLEYYRERGLNPSQPTAIQFFRRLQQKNQHPYIEYVTCMAYHRVAVAQAMAELRDIRRWDATGTGFDARITIRHPDKNSIIVDVLKELGPGYAHTEPGEPGEIVVHLTPATISAAALPGGST